MNLLNCAPLDIAIEYGDGHSLRPHLHQVFTELVSGMYDMEVLGRTVVDVGAFLGETGVYFSRKGARQVICYEPFSTGRMILTNAWRNRCFNILVVHEAVGGEDKFLEVDPNYENHCATRLVYASTPGKCLKQTSLDTLTAQHNIQDGILKLDCEGSEFEIIGKASIETLHRYKAILIEVHTYLGNCETLLAKLVDAGFSVERVTAVASVNDVPYCFLWKATRKEKA